MFFWHSPGLMTPSNGKRVLLGLSGGVDSSASAVLLLEAGYEVIGAFMKNWSGTVAGPSCADAEKVGEEFSECGWREERRDAMRVAAELNIPFLTFDFEKEYREQVVEYLFAEYAAGRTPNPDVMCNKRVKFDLFVKEADKLGCDFVATGHYARVVCEPANLRTCEPKILKGNDNNKDQSYFLWAIPPAVLSRVHFPVGHLPKPEVREIARRANLLTFDKKDSTGICFVGEVDIREFLQARLPKDSGPIVTTDGITIGEHEGLVFYTIGQRHGINVGGGTPYYVVDKKFETKSLIVSSNFHPALFRRELVAREANWFRLPSSSFRCEARVRYRQPVAWCSVVVQDNGDLHVTFDDPQRAVTPGQSIVFYDADDMLGGAVIQ